MGSKLIQGINDLATVNPELAKEWHPTKNGDLLPSMITAGSTRKVWWLGKCGHEWQAMIARRNCSSGCPICANQKILSGFNDLVTTNPELAKEWHPTKNGDLLPNMLSAGSGKKIWWLGKCGHEWQATVENRNGGGGCPICSNKKVLSGYNDLATTNPELAKEWHPTKNGDLLPSMLSAGSNKKVWWLGKCGHEWEALVSSRNQGYGCPICTNLRVAFGINDLATTNPELAKEWHPTKNGNLEPSMVVEGSVKKVWWKCSYGHEWQATIVSRNNGSNCPICSKRLKSSFPEQVIFYYLSKVFDDTESRFAISESTLELDVFIPSLKVAIEYDGVFWHTSNKVVEREKRKYMLCRKNEIKLIRVREIINEEKQNTNNICDYCIEITRKPDYFMLDSMVKKLFAILNIQTSIEIDSQKDEKDIKSRYYLGQINNSLAKLNPKLAEEWHPTKNGSFSPDMFTISSGEKVWWFGKCGHEWQATIAARNSGTGCPYCTGQKRIVGENDFLTLKPELASEWHPTKNGNKKPQDIGANSNQKVWWLGKCGHEWQAVVAGRSNGYGCPICSSRRVLKGFNDLTTTNPELAEEWHPIKNGLLLPNMVFAKSNRKVWWLCKYGHEWQATIENRVNGRGCPYCSNRKILIGFNDLATTNPELAKEWHPTKNGFLSPQMVTAKSSRKVWWLGKCGHEWETRISHRSNGHGCPFCAGVKKKDKKY